MHTSDWHLGRSFHGMSLHRLTKDLLDELVQTVVDERIDVVLVAGDVYDQAQPRTETIGLLSSVLERLAGEGCAVVLSSGNHDSAVRLAFAANLLSKSGIHLVTDPQSLGTPVTITRDDTTVAIYPIPYLEPRAVAETLGTEPSHEAVLAEACERIRQDAAGRDVAAKIVMAHCFATGAEPSASERDISVGGAISVSQQIFAGFDYTALGHLHGRQRLSETVRYSGSLLAYSFSEEKHRKGGWIIDVGPEGVNEIREHRWETKLPLVSLTGTLEELLTDEKYAAHAQDVCRITLTDAQRPLGAIDRLRQRFGTVAELNFAPSGNTPRRERPSLHQLHEKPVTEVCGDFYQHVRQAELSEEESRFLNRVTSGVQEELNHRDVHA